jgi:hypothetical protein
MLGDTVTMRPQLSALLKIFGENRHLPVRNSMCNTGYHDRVMEEEKGTPCSRNGKKRDVYRILVGKSEGKRPLEIPRRR